MHVWILRIILEYFDDAYEDVAVAVLQDSCTESIVHISVVRKLHCF